MQGAGQGLVAVLRLMLQSRKFLGQPTQARSHRAQLVHPTQTQHQSRLAHSRGLREHAVGAITRVPRSRVTRSSVLTRRHSSSS